MSLIVQTCREGRTLPQQIKSLFVRIGIDFLADFRMVLGQIMSHNPSPFPRRHNLLRSAPAWLLMFITVAAQASLNVTNFSSTNVIQIMPMGDSITDDCEVQGAWREPLQPLFDSNGIQFNFVGRENSSFTVGQAFTKVHHEGYCGAVIASPGVSTPEHFYTAAQNYLDNIAPDALAAHTPNILLVLIGANDIGHGRNPTLTGGTIISNFLSIVFADDPGVNVILAKITTLSNAALGYAPYATNVPIYNAALQAQVNIRHAKGQNVYLADMFSQVDYNTMFMSDHLHPNALGLATMAQEWYTRVQSILTGTNRVTVSLIHGGDTWSYSDTGTDLGANWSQPGFDDSQWKSGLGRFGYGELPDATKVSFGSDSNNVNTTTYFRKKIVVPWNQYFTNLNFRLTETAGAVVYVNGQEFYRTNLPPGPISYSTPATTNIVGDPEYIYYQNNFATTLVPGTNVIAVEVHQNNATNSVLGFDMELLGGAWVVPPPTLSASVIATNIVLNWPVTNGAAFSLYSSPQLTGAPWQPVSAPLQTNSGQITASVPVSTNGGFFQLQLNQ
jgi:lysophospholipase L1-like esterase